MQEKKKLNHNNLWFVIISFHGQPVSQAYHLPAWLYMNELPEQLIKIQPLENMKAPF